MKLPTILNIHLFNIFSHYVASESWEVFRECVFIGAKCPGKQWGAPIFLFSGRWGLFALG
jgi:hypothetical protein